MHDLVASDGNLRSRKGMSKRIIEAEGESIELTYEVRTSYTRNHREEKSECKISAISLSRSDSQESGTENAISPNNHNGLPTCSR